MTQPPPAPILQADLESLLKNGSDREVMFTILMKLNDLCVSGKANSDAIEKSMREGNNFVKNQLDDFKTFIETKDAWAVEQITILPNKIVALEE